MPISDSKRRSDRKWREANYDKICIQVKRGFRDLWKAYADRFGLSLASLICNAVEEYIQNHSGGDSID